MLHFHAEAEGLKYPAIDFEHRCRSHHQAEQHEGDDYQETPHVSVPLSDRTRYW